jgi:hypothetical protein
LPIFRSALLHGIIFQFLIEMCELSHYSGLVANGGRDDQFLIPDFSSTLCVQTDFGAHPATCTVGTWVKARLGRDADHLPPFSAEVKKSVRARSRFHPSASMACSGNTIFNRLVSHVLFTVRCKCLHGLVTYCALCKWLWAWTTVAPYEWQTAGSRLMF